MTANGRALHEIVRQAEALSPEDRLHLIQRLVESLRLALRPERGRPLVYGEFRQGRQSNEDDFRLAEWRPAPHELDG